MVIDGGVVDLLIFAWDDLYASICFQRMLGVFAGLNHPVAGHRVPNLGLKHSRQARTCLSSIIRRIWENDPNAEPPLRHPTNLQRRGRKGDAHAFPWIWGKVAISRT